MKQRGTQDEYEIIKLIVFSNRTLYNKVLERIRNLRKELRETPLDSGRTRYDKNIELKQRDR